MPEKPVLKSDLLADPLGEALGDVYLFLLRKAAERKQGITATIKAERIASNLPVQAEITAPDGQVDELLSPVGAPGETRRKRRKINQASDS